MRSWFALWIVVLGCNKAEPDPLDALIVEHVELRNWTLSSFALLGGALSGEADLALFPVQGEPLVMPVGMRGGTFGLAMDFQLVGGPLSPVVLELPAAEVPASSVLGKYRGGGQSVVALLGFDNHRLKNRDDVVLDATLLAGGFSVMFAAEWLRIEQTGPLELLDPPVEDTGGSDTGLR